MSRTQRITIEVPADLLAEARAATGEGVTATVREGLKILASRRYAVRIALHDAAGWRDMLDTGLQESGGPLTNDTGGLIAVDSTRCGVAVPPLAPARQASFPP